MISFDDPGWGGLRGGYRLEYDPRPALRSLTANPGDPDAWAELWENLHHQGGVGDASYAAVPHLVALQPLVGRDNWQVYSMVALIEGRRGEGENPPVPGWIEPGYLAALVELGVLAAIDVRAASDVLVKRAALGVFALTSGLRRWGQLISEMSEDEVFQALGWE
jgi:hypothetical protein